MSVSQHIHRVLSNTPDMVSWATGGILTRDPRRVGRNSTSSFATSEMGDILPTMVVVPGPSTRAFNLTAPVGAVDLHVYIRLFAPDNLDSDFDSVRDLETIQGKIRALFHNVPLMNDLGEFQGTTFWSDDFQPTTNEAYKDVWFAESHIVVVDEI